MVDFVNGFKEPEQLQHFLDMWKKADGIHFPPDEGAFYKIDIPDEVSKDIDRVVNATGKKRSEIIDEMIDKGLEKLAKEYGTD